MKSGSSGSVPGLWGSVLSRNPGLLVPNPGSIVAACCIPSSGPGKDVFSDEKGGEAACPHSLGSVTDRFGARGTGCRWHSTPPPHSPLLRRATPGSPPPLHLGSLRMQSGQVHGVGPGRGRPRPPDRCFSQKKTPSKYTGSLTSSAGGRRDPQGACEPGAGRGEGGHHVRVRSQPRECLSPSSESDHRPAPLLPERGPPASQV